MVMAMPLGGYATALGQPNCHYPIDHNLFIAIQARENLNIGAIVGSNLDGELLIAVVINLAIHEICALLF